MCRLKNDHFLTENPWVFNTSYIWSSTICLIKLFFDWNKWFLILYFSFSYYTVFFLYPKTHSMYQSSSWSLQCQVDKQMHQYLVFFLYLFNVRSLPGTPVKDAQNIFAMNWRFFPSLDPQVDIFLSRDLDSRINEREALSTRGTQNEHRVSKNRET